MAGKRGNKRGGPKPATRERLEKAALAYLERYASSTANLRRVLQRRVDRAARVHDTDTAAAAEWIEAILAELQSRGLLDDRVYAEGRVASLRRAGQSARAIRQKLAEKGVDGDTIEAALAAHESDSQQSDVAAAVAYARRRRLGPFNTRGDRTARRDKDMAAMGRRGFDLDTARLVIDAEDSEAAEALADEPMPFG